MSTASKLTAPGDVIFQVQDYSCKIIAEFDTLPEAEAWLKKNPTEASWVLEIQVVKRYLWEGGRLADRRSP